MTRKKQIKHNKEKTDLQSQAGNKSNRRQGTQEKQIEPRKQRRKPRKQRKHDMPNPDHYNFSTFDWVQLTLIIPVEAFKDEVRFY